MRNKKCGGVKKERVRARGKWSGGAGGIERGEEGGFLRGGEEGGVGILGEKEGGGRKGGAGGAKRVSGCGGIGERRGKGRKGRAGTGELGRRSRENWGGGGDLRGARGIFWEEGERKRGDLGF